ncbi:hypothetical protein AVU38_gp176 [Ralstonia phage RSL2]|uniref:Uncharacterized protein n=1 Tax=Ralstonia phage RSL2 TaxID=1585840 RepID=A0A0A8J9M4_9CAUD|nr:hypothetical protein AVU38_gp176 [Ralstonia phage RSL2]BAQ02704.1 hypothetical protein [Ralstonia phage RSL2]
MMRGDSIFTWDKFNDNEDIRKQAMQSAADGGPNSGFEMPDTSFFKQPELANEFPEMKDDIDLIISTESYVQRLVDLERRMKKEKGMSRGMAYELLELVPSLESHIKPSYFTEDVSGVGYEPSLEAISGQMWVVIAAAAAFLVAIIYKFISWLFGGGNGSSGGGSGSLDKAEEGVRESEKKVEQQEKVLERTVSKVKSVKGKQLNVRMPNAISHEEIRKSSLPESIQDQIIREIPDLLDNTQIDPKAQREHFLKIDLGEALMGVEGGKEVLEYMRKPSRYARVVFAQERSDAMSLITASFEGFNSYSKIMVSELDALEEAFNFMKAGQSAFADSSATFTSHRKEESSLLSLAKISDERPAAFKIGSHTFESAPAWAQALRDSIHDAGSKEPNFNDLEELLSGYQIGVRRLKEVNWRGMIVFIELLKKSQPIMAQLEAKAEELRKNAKDKEKFDSAEYRANAKTIIGMQRILTENYTGLMRVYAEISRVYTEVTKNAADVVNTLKKNAAGIVALYNKVKEMVPPSLEELVDDLSDLSKEARESTVNQHMLPFVSVSHLKVSFGGSDDNDDEDRPSITMSTSEAENALRIVTGQPKKED